MSGHALDTFRHFRGGRVCAPLKEQISPAARAFNSCRISHALARMESLPCAKCFHHLQGIRHFPLRRSTRGNAEHSGRATKSQRFVSVGRLWSFRAAKDIWLPNRGREVAAMKLSWRSRRENGHRARASEGGKGECEGTTDEENLDGIVGGMREFLVSEEALASQAAVRLVAELEPRGRKALLTALFRSDPNDPESHFAEADANLDGMIDRSEFGAYVEAQSIKYGFLSKPLTSKQTFHLFCRAAIGMVGFGFIDNAIMIIAGDAIENSIGTALGLTTLLSAGLGNAVADLVGTAFRGYIERLSSKFMPEVHVSTQQMQQNEAWWAETVGASAGVTVGCLLGLAPLFILHRPRSTAQDQDQDESRTARRNDEGKFASLTASSSIVSLEGKELHRSSSSSSSCPHVAAVIAPFHSRVWGTPLLLLVILVMALRRVTGFRWWFRRQGWSGGNRK